MHIDDIAMVTISLDRRPDRWAKFLTGATDAGIQRRVKRLSAVDAKGFIGHKHPSISLLTAHNVLKGTRRSHYEIDKAGAIGCSLSHFKAWQECLNSSAPAMIIFEDDAQIPVDFMARLGDVLEDLPAAGSWDIITFYNREYSGGVKGCMPDLKKAQAPWSTCTSLMGAHAYMISRKGAQLMLDRAYPIELHVDAYMAFMARMENILMIWHPRLSIIQTFDDSDIDHGGLAILNVPTNMENQGLIAIKTTSVLSMMTMAAIVGGMLALADVVRLPGRK